MSIVSATTFRSLAAGSGGAKAAAELYDLQLIRRLALLRGVAEEARLSAHPEASIASAAYMTLSELGKEHPEAVSRVLRHPAVASWAWSAFTSLRSHKPVRPGRLGAVALAATVAAGAARHINVVLEDDGTLMLPSLGLLAPTGISTEIDVEGNGLSAADWSADLDLSADGHGWSVLHRVRLAEDFEVVVDDLDPYRWSESDQVAPRLTPQARASWETKLEEAWKILLLRHPTVAEEVATIISTITPIHSHGSGVASASSRQSFGTIAMSTPSGRPAWLAETFAHEIQHAKLDALMQLIPLIRYERADLFYAPWRPDPRPAHGLLQGAYAYLGVVEFWRREHPIEGHLGRVEFARWRAGVEEVLDTLMKENLLTDSGKDFVDGMRTTLADAIATTIDDRALTAAQEAAAVHRGTWLARNM
uniref:aKG-HExxH-type peptide beta-hydroxylase n=1 Tax=Herbidospora sakaeratensis TaxID=564415 RepID=UPI000785BC82|nr:HEXXH motif-containing putative peptide modification protein [Herbidospora sakaeratensis]